MVDDLDNIKLKMLTSFKEYTTEVFESNDANLREIKQHLNVFFEAWNLARVDIKNTGSKDNNIKLSKNYPDYKISFPSFLNTSEGNGLIVQSRDKKIKIECTGVGDGKLSVILRGVDFKGLNDKRIPIYIDVTNFNVNDYVIFSNSTLVAHDSAFPMSDNLEDGDEITVELEIKTIFDYYPQLELFCNELKDDSVDANNFYNMVNYYLNYEIALLNGESLDSYEKYNLSKENYNLSKINDLTQENAKLSQNVNKLSNDYNVLINRFNELSNNFSNYKNETEKIADSYNSLFTSLFKYHKLEPSDMVKYSRQLTLELLDFIDFVCKKHDLQWWLDGGSLLGSVRHKGYIPWDDDLDIGMLRKDYEKFIKIINGEIANCYLQDNIKATTKAGNGGLHFLKMEYRVKGSLFSFVDIFAYDFVPEVADDLEEIYEREYHRLHKELKAGKNRFAVLNESFKALNVCEEKTDILINAIERYDLRVYNYDVIFPLKKSEFEGKSYSCPNNIDEFLKIFFGTNYMDVPKVIAQHGFYDFLSGLDNNVEILKEHTKLLKEINDSNKL